MLLDQAQRLLGHPHLTGRDPGSFGVEARIEVSTATAPDAWRAEAHELARLGVGHIALDSAGVGLETETADFHLSRLREAGEVVRREF